VVLPGHFFWRRENIANLLSVCLSKIIIAPLTRANIMSQTKCYTQRDFTLTEFFTKIPETQGISGLFAGAVAEVLQHLTTESIPIILPYTLLLNNNFCSFARISVRFFFDTVILYVMTSYPQKPPRYFTAVAKFFSNLGSINSTVALANSFFCTFIMTYLYTKIFHAIFRTTKKLDRLRNNEWIALLFGSIIATSAVYPLDTVRKCVILMPNANIFQIIKNIYRSSGILGFYSGFSTIILIHCVIVIVAQATDTVAARVVFSIILR